MPNHKIKSTECGEAHFTDEFRTLWGSVDCVKCLARRPPPADPRMQQGPHLCRECFKAESTCQFCSRCDEHCLAKAPRDEAAHPLLGRTPRADGEAQTPLVGEPAWSRIRPHSPLVDPGYDLFFCRTPRRYAGVAR
jgi:hypothetical protein